MNINRSLLTDFTAINISRELAAMTQAAQTLSTVADLDETMSIVSALQSASEETEPQDTVSLLNAIMPYIKAIGQKSKFPELENYADKAVADLEHTNKVATTLLNLIVSGVQEGEYIIAAHGYLGRRSPLATPRETGYVLSGTDYSTGNEFLAAEARFPHQKSYFPLLDNSDNRAAVVSIAASTDRSRPDSFTMTMGGDTAITAPNGEEHWKLSIHPKSLTFSAIDFEEEYYLIFDEGVFRIVRIGEYIPKDQKPLPLNLFQATPTVAEAEIGTSPVSLVDDTIDNIVDGLKDIIAIGLNPFTEYNGISVRMTINNRNANPVYHVFNQHFTALPRHLLLCKNRSKRPKYRQFFNVSENVRLMPVKHQLKAMTHMDFIIDLNSLNKVSPLFRGVAADVKIYLLYGDPVEENLIK